MMNLSRQTFDLEDNYCLLLLIVPSVTLGLEMNGTAQGCQVLLILQGTVEHVKEAVPDRGRSWPRIDCFPCFACRFDDVAR